MTDTFHTRRLRVLVVDDHRDDLKMFGMWLELMQCEVRTCVDPEHCLQIAREFQPHLVFLDLAMPGMSGFEVAQRFRDAQLPPFLLVARTGYADARTKTECLQRGFNLVLPKPVDLDEMKRLLDTARNFAAARSASANEIRRNV
jgi:CheY-like chemotaxis protein